MRLPHPHRPRLSYANVASTLALVVATSTGGAYAAATIGSAQIKDDAVKSRHIAAGNVKTPDLRDGAVSASKLLDGSVTGTKIEDGAVTGSKLGDGAVTGPKIEDGSVGRSKLGTDVAAARAFGTVFHTGSVQNSHNLTSANVVRPETGVYCISGLSFAPAIAVASSTLEPNAFHHDVEIYGIAPNFSASAPCPAGTQLQIRVYQPGTTTEANGNFNIVIF